MIKIDKQYLSNFISQEDYNAQKECALQAYNTLLNKNGLGNDFLGWLDLPSQMVQTNEIESIKKVANKITSNSDVLVVIGIGGSYLGSKAVIESQLNSFKKQDTEIVYAGHNISSTYLTNLIEYLQNKDFSINIISKSGTTTEPAIAFRLLKELLVSKYGEDANSRIIATTDPKDGTLKEQALANNWTTFDIPKNVGGRYSVFTAVGLLPIAVTGIDVDALLAGANKAQQEFSSNKDNVALEYSTYRNILLNKNKYIEVMVGYEPSMTYICEWYKQLFGESEGKEGKGIFPASVINTTDLHSMGQFIQEGNNILFETIIKYSNASKDINIPQVEGANDGLDYLEGSKLSYVNDTALKATAIAHVDGKVPNIVLELNDMKEESLGYALYFFMFSCGLSAYQLGINPFDQPGVEAYKKNMFALLGKPGFENININ
ncbi:MAG: glucose-6-phosphate isomerase [Mycoplasmatales bacterium]